MSEQICGDRVDEVVHEENNDKLKDDVLKILAAIDTETATYNLDELEQEHPTSTLSLPPVAHDTQVNTESKNIQPSPLIPTITTEPLLNFAGRFVTSMASVNPFEVKKRFVKPRFDMNDIRGCDPCGRRTIEHIIRKLSGRDDLTKLLLLIMPTTQSQGNHKMHCFALESQRHLSVTSVTSDESNWIEEHHCSENYQLMFITRSILLEDLVKHTPIKSQLFSVVSEGRATTRQAWYQGTVFSIYFLKPDPSCGHEGDSDGRVVSNRFGIKSLNLPKIPVRPQDLSLINKNDRLAQMQKYRFSEKTLATSGLLSRHTYERIQKRRARLSEPTSELNKTALGHRSRSCVTRKTSTHKRLEQEALQLKLEREHAKKAKEIILRRKSRLNDKVMDIRRKMDLRSDESRSCSVDNTKERKACGLYKTADEQEIQPVKKDLSIRNETPSALSKPTTTNKRQEISSNLSPSPANESSKQAVTTIERKTATYQSVNGKAAEKTIRYARKQTVVRFCSDTPEPFNGTDNNGRSVSKKPAIRYTSSSYEPANGKAAEANKGKEVLTPKKAQFQMTQHKQELEKLKTESNQLRLAKERQAKIEEELRKPPLKHKCMTVQTLENKRLKNMKTTMSQEDDEEARLQAQEQKRVRIARRKLMAARMEHIRKYLQKLSDLVKAKEEGAQREREDAKLHYEQLRQKMSERRQREAKLRLATSPEAFTESAASKGSTLVVSEQVGPPRKSTIVYRNHRAQSASEKKKPRIITTPKNRPSVSTIGQRPCHGLGHRDSKNICFAELLIDRPPTETKGIQITSERLTGDSEDVEVVVGEPIGPPVDKNGVRVLWEPCNLRESHGRIPNYNFAVQLLTPAIQEISNSDSCKSVIHKSSQSLDALLIPLEVPQSFSERAKVKLQQKLKNLDLRTAFTKFGYLIESINNEPKPFEKHLYVFFQFVEVFEFNLFARREVNFSGCEPTNDPRCRVECYAFEDRRDFVGSVAMLATQLGRYARTSRYVSNHLRFVDDAFALTIMPSGLTRCLKCVCNTLHADRLYELLAELTFSCLQPPATLLSEVNKRNKENHSYNDNDNDNKIKLSARHTLSFVMLPTLEVSTQSSGQSMELSEQISASTSAENYSTSKAIRQTPFEKSEEDSEQTQPKS